MSVNPTTIIHMLQTCGTSGLYSRSQPNPQICLLPVTALLLMISAACALVELAPLLCHCLGRSRKKNISVDQQSGPCLYWGTMHGLGGSVPSQLARYVCHQFSNHPFLRMTCMLGCHLQPLTQGAVNYTL
jgi:hypothetical protein